MGTKKWSEIKKLSKATEADRAEAKAELDEEVRRSRGPWTIQQIIDQQDELAYKFEAFDPSTGREMSVEEYLERRRNVDSSSVVTEVDFAPPWIDQLAPAPAREHTVAGLLPAGFERYMRVFHPFVPWAAEPEEPVPSASRRRWGDVARSAGVTFSPTLTWRQLESVLAVDANGDRPYGVWEGELELNTSEALFAALPQENASGYFFYFGLAAIIRTDARTPATYFVRSLGDRGAVLEAVRCGLGASIATAEYVWPIDRAWIVCTDYDLTSTYVALSAEAATRLLAEPDIEAVEVNLDTRIDDAADEQQTSPTSAELSMDSQETARRRDPS